MKTAKNLRHMLMIGAASVALFACSDTDIASPGATVAPTPTTPTPTTPTPATPTATSLVPAGFDASHPAITVTNFTTAAGTELEVAQITGPITSDLTLVSGVGYYLDGSVFVGNDGADNSVLTIEPGTVIYGEGSSSGLIVTRGSQIIADATSGADRAPTSSEAIVFTSFGAYDRANGNSSDDATTARAEWLGLVINGYAPINKCDVVTGATGGTADCQDDGEASSGVYGGGIADDNSGTLRGVRVEHAGVFYNEEDQSNGIAFQGVGSGTTVDYIQVHNNGDDGVEFFGGTVQANHVVITGASDDAVDWTDGWTGGIKNLLVVQADDTGDYAIEADNRSTSAPDTQPRSFPTIANFTFIGNGTGADGIRLREGTAANLLNGVVTGFDDGIKFGDDSTFNLLATPSSVDSATTEIEGVLFNNADETGDVVDDQGTDDTADDVTTVADATIVTAIGTEGSFFGVSEIASATFEFVPGLTAGQIPVRNANGFPLYNYNDGNQYAPADPAETIPTGVTQESQVFVLGALDQYAINDSANADAYAGAFSPSETEADNWAAGWTTGVFAETTPAAATCPTGTTSNGITDGNLICNLSGIVTSDVTLTAQNNVLYRLDGQVFVGTDGGSEATNTSNSVQATLTIEAGVTVFGDRSTDGLVISRGSQIDVNGTAAAPVVMTSGDAIRGTADFATDTAQWLGLSINGKAPINKCDVVTGAIGGSSDCQDDGEASSGQFGGAISDDDSGDINYLRVEFAGIFFNEEDQSNGIQFQGVGNGGNYDFIQVHNNGDDGLEFFGGTANVKHAVITGAGDDSIDWTDGWTGNVQYAIIEHTDSSDYAFEGDNRSTSAPDTTPRSAPAFSNITILGDDTNGLRFREGSAGDFVNSIMVDTAFGVRIDDACNAGVPHGSFQALTETTANSAEGNLRLASLMLDTIDSRPFRAAPAVAPDGSCLSTTYTDADVQAEATDFATTASLEAGFTFYGKTGKGFVPGTNEANVAKFDASTIDSFFDTTTYIGAVENASDTWYLGWTVNSAGEVTSAN